MTHSERWVWAAPLGSSLSRVLESGGATKAPRQDVDSTYPSRSIRKIWLPRVTILVGAAALVGVTLFALTYTGVLNIGRDHSGSKMVTLFGHFDAPPEERLNDFLAMPPTPQGELSIANLVIPKIDVDAPVGAKGADASGVMESPDGPWDVVWYDFTAKPGVGGNAVFGGHVDYVNLGPAVFWELRYLVQGDMIEIRLKDSTVYRYRVAAMATVDVDAGTEDLGKVLGPTEQEVITLITCNGTFDRAAQTYDERLIVRAERITDNAAGQTPR